MPNLVVFNPPLKVRRMLQKGSRFVGQISNQVHQIRYKHADDGENYVHDFEDSPGVQMFAVQSGGGHALLIVGRDGQKLWDEFDVS